MSLRALSKTATGALPARPRARVVAGATQTTQTADRPLAKPAVFNASRPRHDDARVVWGPAEMIRLPGVNAVVIPSPANKDAKLAPSVIEKEFKDVPDVRLDVPIRRDDIDAGARAFIDGLPAGAGSPELRVALADDVARLAKAFFVACPDLTAVKATLELVSFVPCPRWHVDKVRARLICTYAGAGTRLVENAAVKRSPLLRRRLRGDAGFVVNEAHAVSTGSGEALLLKGEAWPQYEGLAVVHASPEDPGKWGRRLIVKLDAADDVCLDACCAHNH
ncbi:unnamed protein product [Pedinophyceae sp. YPF-701]|nr:unnamed protein product [Pedinophyceae sp. YPF-701]